MPLIWRNKIEQCAFDGIIVYGPHCEPDIRGNVIANNRKSGIKIMKNAIAHIGGNSLEDIDYLPDMPQIDLQQIPINPDGLMQTPGVAPPKLSAESLSTLEAIQKESPQLDNKYFRNQMTMKYLKDYVDGTFRLKSFPNCNVIRYNYNQGILIVEGCHATIIANKIDANIKANIALGGEGSGKTKIKFNRIENSKSEGIFVIEGEDQLLIDQNVIKNNFYGIVLVDSNGVIKENQIMNNYTSGLLTEKNTVAKIHSNVISNNMTTGIIIKDPSLPDLKKNSIKENNMF